MKKTIKKQMWILYSGLLGAFIMMSSDWLMIYGDTSYQGNLAWLTQGVAKISASRNALALGLGFLAIIFYSVALLGMKQYIVEEKQKTIYMTLTTISMTPWLCVHLLYLMILFLFQWMHTKQYFELAYLSTEALFAQFSWVIILSEVLMLLPFVYWFILVFQKKTVFSKCYALNNPLFFYILLKAFTMILPDVPARLAFVNGLMSEAMFLWFLVWLFHDLKKA